MPQSNVTLKIYLKHKTSFYFFLSFLLPYKEQFVLFSNKLFSHTIRQGTILFLFWNFLESSF
jgi:hypothetical protein